MKIFTVDKNGKMVKFKEQDFKSDYQEIDLEDLLENNPEFFFEDSKILIIGRQVTTNLNSFIDLLGIDKNGNTFVIELKRDKTPRETLSQLLEYASFVDNLDYNNLNELFKNFSGDESELEYYHSQYFNLDSIEIVSFNKSIKMMIIAQEISREIKQTTLFLRKKGIEVYCLEFKLFMTKSGDKIISTDTIIGDDDFIQKKVKSAPLPKIDEKQFMDSLDKNGLPFFKKIFDFAKQNDLIFRWGSKGFSLNVSFESGFVGLIFGYPPNSVFKQSIYTGFEEITKKANHSQEIIDVYKKRLKDLRIFIQGGTNLKLIINKSYSEKIIDNFISILKEIIDLIKKRGLK